MRFTPLSVGFLGVFLSAASPVQATPNGIPVLEPTPALVGTITGKVTDKTTGQPVPSASVTVTGTRFGATTDEEGRFRISGVEDGAQTVVAKRLGYTQLSMQVTVRSGADVTADFALAKSTTMLEAVVSTVTGDQRKVEVGNTMATLTADSLMAHAPITNLQEMLATRVPGVLVMSGQGATGISARIRIRGLSSIAGGRDPLLIIDGARVDALQGGTSTILAGSNIYGQVVGRLNDYNPADIESIDVVKGAAAATLYGSDAANGVIVIKTKKGKAGRNQWTAYGEGGALWVPVGIYPPNYFSWGHTAAGVPRQCKLTDQYVDNACTIDSLTTYSPFTNPEQNPLTTGTRTNMGLQTSGGVRQFRYFLSTGYENEIGILKMPPFEQQRLRLERSSATIPDDQIRPNTMRKFHTRANSGATVGTNADVGVSFGLLSSETRLPSAGGVYQGQEFGLGINTACGGWYTCTTPGETFAVRNTDQTTHFTTSINGNWQPTKALNFRSTIGRDFSSTFIDNLQRRNEGPFGVNRDGRRANTKMTNGMTSLDVGGSLSFTPHSVWTSQTSFGAQYNARLTVRSTVSGTGLPPGRDILIGAAAYTGNEATNENKTAGLFVEEKIGWNDRLFGALAVRADGGSTFGRNFNTAFYPKGSLSWLASEESFMPKTDWMTNLRFRTAYGAAGVQPSSTAALALYQFFSGQVDGTAVSGAHLSAFGNPQLRPERQREFEYGVDVDFLNSRVHVEYTSYDRRSKDALVEIPMPTSVAGPAVAYRQENLGSVRNWGHEVLINARLFDTPALVIDLGGNGSITNNKLVSATNDQVLSQPGINTKTNSTRLGYPLFSLWEKRILSWSDADGNGIITPTEILNDTARSFAGAGLPNHQVTLTPAFSLFKERVRFSSQFDYRGGHTIINFTEINRCAIGGCQGINDPKASLWEQARAVAFNKQIADSKGVLYTGNYWGYLEPGYFTRWREASLSITMPERVLRLSRAKSAVLLVSARNLHLWTGYTGVDPELQDAQGHPNTEGYTSNPAAPSPRYFIVRLTLGM